MKSRMFGILSFCQNTFSAFIWIILHLTGYLVLMAASLFGIFSTKLKRTITKHIFWSICKISELRRYLAHGKIIVCGDSITNLEENILIIGNHYDNTDWMVFNALLQYMNRLNSCYKIAGYHLKLTPLGFAMQMCGTFFIKGGTHRDYYLRELKKFCQRNLKNGRRLSILLFPEGSVVTNPRAREERKEYCKNQGIDNPFKHVLYPRFRAMKAILDAVAARHHEDDDDWKIKFIVDLTLIYPSDYCSKLDVLINRWPQHPVYIHVKKIPIQKITRDGASLHKWLTDKFERKDRIIGKFKYEGTLPTSWQENVEEIKIPPREMIAGVLVWLVYFLLLILFLGREVMVYGWKPALIEIVAFLLVTWVWEFYPLVFNIINAVVFVPLSLFAFIGKLTVRLQEIADLEQEANRRRRYLPTCRPISSMLKRVCVAVGFPRAASEAPNGNFIVMNLVWKLDTATREHKHFRMALEKAGGFWDHCIIYLFAERKELSVLAGIVEKFLRLMFVRSNESLHRMGIEVSSNICLIAGIGFIAANSLWSLLKYVRNILHKRKQACSSQQGR